jgi:hypothetical protein
MYCAIHFSGKGGNGTYQTGDRDNKQMVKALKKDLIAAVKRGAIIEIGNLHPIKSMGV